MTPLGIAIDLSSNNPHVDLARVQAAGVSLVFLRGTIGRVFSKKDIDPTVYERANECRQLGLDFAVYGDNLARHGREQDAAEQALDLWRLHQEVGATCVPAQDIEPEGTGAVGAEWRVAVDAFADILVIEAGRPCISYCGPGFVEQYGELVADTWLGERTLLWCAAYVDQRPAPFTPWRSMALWQRQGGGAGLPARFVGSCPGVDGPCDVSEMLVPVEALRV